MNLRRMILLVLLIGAAAALTRAVQTNYWYFTSATNYAVSDPAKIEVADSVAKLKLKAQSLYQTTIADYMTNAASYSSLAVGPDASVVLTRTGGLYRTPGVYQSRVFDGGPGGLNTWQRFYGKASNKSLVVENVPGGMTAGMAGLVALYHMDGTWLDSVSGQFATPVGGPTFTTHSKFGSFAAQFGGSPQGAVCVGSNLLNGAHAFTLAFWIDLLQASAGGGVLGARATDGAKFGLYMDGGGLNLNFVMNNGGPFATASITTGSWYFVVLSWQSTDYRVQLFLNGTLAASGGTPAWSTLDCDRALQLCNADGQYVKARIDDLAIFNRVLSADEVMNIYNLASAAKFQIRSGPSSDLTGASFVGPSGAADTYFLNESTVLSTTGSIDVTHRFIQYQAYLSSDITLSATPAIEAAGFVGANGVYIDTGWGDFLTGSFVSNTVPLPSKTDTPFLGGGKTVNGGYATNSYYISRVLDGGPGVAWGTISWNNGDALPSDLPGLQGLWHVDGLWSDSSGNGYSGAGIGATFYNNAKLGSRCAAFNGTSGYAQMSSIPASLYSVEFWMLDDNMNDGLLEFVPNTTYLCIANGVVTPVGFPASQTTVYVNGKPGGALMPGWNHVALVTGQGYAGVALVLGRANGDYMQGYMDEIAVYSRQLTAADVSDHFIRSRRTMAGQTWVQVRSGPSVDSVTNNAFTGPATAPGYFTDPSGLALAGYTNRYLQYKVTFVGDGSGAPALNWLQITYNSGSAFLDDTIDEFGQGDLATGGARWYGDELSLQDYASIGPANMDRTTMPGLLALWHMDEASWAAGVADASGNGQLGGSEGGAQPATGARVGARCGSFDGVSGSDVMIPGLNILSNDFTVALWFESTTAARSGLISTYSGGAAAYYSLSLNYDGASTSAGKACFTINNGAGTTRAAVSSIATLNDGAWHHLAGVRSGRQIHIYADGNLVGSADIGVNFGNLGGASGYLACEGTLGNPYKGLLDEVAVVGRALSEAEIGGLAAAGCYTLARGTFTGAAIDGTQRSIWEQMVWGADAPYGLALASVDPAMRGLWHLDAVTNGTTVVDASGAGNDGILSATGAITTNTGRFGGGLTLAEGLGGHVTVTPGVTPLDNVPFSIEAWINAEDVLGHVIVDRDDTSTGWRIGLDGTGRPYFWLNGQTCSQSQILRSRQWTHVAATYDGTYMRLYVNGFLKNKLTYSSQTFAPAGPLCIGTDSSGTPGTGFFGRIDEVALYARTLTGEEVLDRYRAGAVTLKLQAQSWTAGGPGTFVGPDGTAGTYFTDPANSSLLAPIPLNEFFQYRAYLQSGDYRLNPRFQGIRIDTSTYPQDKPYVTPTDATRLAFPGNLISFGHTMATNADSMVTYQITGDTNDTATWYYWSGSQWADSAGLSGNANTRDIINQQIGTFFSQLYPKSGGLFKFKALLQSSGYEQTALKEVHVGYSLGRVLVTVPNGTEVGPNAWLIGVTNIIQWTSVGTVSANVRIDYSLDGGTTWATVNANAPNAANATNQYAWVTPGAGASDEQADCLVRVSDPHDPTISDVSDGPFQLVYRFRLLAPNGGEKWYIGTTNAVIWESPPSIGSLSWLWYNLNGSTQLTDFVRISGQNISNTQGATNSVYMWSIPTVNNDLLSEHARMLITIQGSQARADMSDADYVLAGIGFLAPNQATAWRRGSTHTISWLSAGAGTNGVNIDFSPDGVVWSNIAVAVTNVTGSNSYAWAVSSANPTTNAYVKITAVADPLVHNTSAPFTVADIDVKAPLSGVVWAQGVTNLITWTAGGAGNSVNLYYSSDDGVSWNSIVQGYTNVDFPATNTYAWTVPQDPTTYARVKVESALSPDLFNESARFNIAGLRVTAPNGGETWRMDATNAIDWVAAAAGGDALVEFSYDNGVTYTNLGINNLGAFTAPYVPNFPSVRCLARVTAVDVSNVTDTSDSYFTVAGIKTILPAAGAVYTMGVTSTSAIVWYSAGTLASVVNVSYAPEDGSQSQLMQTPNNEAAQNLGVNTRDWTPSMSLDPSALGHISVFASAAGGSYTGLSQRFTLRGVRITAPVAGSVWRIGFNNNITWLTAGFNAGVVADFYVSSDGGATFNPTPLIAWDTDISLKQAIWTIDPLSDPTTNAVVRMVLTNSPISFQAVSAPFVLRGIKVVNPMATNNWAIGTTNTIQFLSAAAGNLANIYYSSDGTTYDLARPIASGVFMPGGLSTSAWAIEPFRTPSTQARIKVQSTTLPDFAVSDPFTVGGITVQRPQATDIWAVGETNRIQWSAVGTLGTNRIELIMSDSSVVLLANNQTGSYYDWVVPTNAVGSNLTIRVSDVGGYFGVSQPFRIVSQPTVQIISPSPGAFWKVTSPYVIQWSKAGNMADSFDVEYSADNFATSTFPPGSPVLSNGVYSLPWTPPALSTLGPTRLRVTNTGNPLITDTSQPFYLVALLTMTTPAGGETYYALKSTEVDWNTAGAATLFDLYYSTDPARGTGSWVKAVTSAPVIGNGNASASHCFWTVPNLKSATTWLRIQDHNYTDMYPWDQPGPFADCAGSFSINYYRVVWHVYDSANTNMPTFLDQLSVTDSSGWSSNSLTANPYIVKEYPDGVFDTVWSREFFYDKIVFNWSPDDSGVPKDVPMNQSQVAPDFKVMANFAYDSTTTNYTVSSWLERAGKIVPAPSASIITIFDRNGAQIASLTNLVPDAASGIFWQKLTGLVVGQTYFARVEIQFSGVTYSSGLTFQLSVPAGADQAAQILATVGSIQTNLANLSSAQADFRATATAKLDVLTNIIGQVTSITNINSLLSTLNTQTLARLDMLTNTIGVIGPTETNLVDTVRAFREETLQRTSRILTRPTTVKLGDGFDVLYRSRAGTTAMLTVSNLTTGTSLYYPLGLPMTALAGGVYEKYLPTTIAWGVGDCLVTCTDGLGVQDSMIVKVTSFTVDDVALSLTNIGASISQMEVAVTGMSAAMSNVTLTVSDLNTNLAGLLGDVSDMYVAVSNMQATIRWTNVTDILSAVQGMSNGLSVLGTNIASVNWTNLSALSGLAPQLASVQATVSNLQSTVAPQLTYMTNLLTRVSVVTNMAGDVAYLTNVIGSITVLTNLTPQVGILTNAIAGLVGFAPQLAYITNTMGQVVGLTNLYAVLPLTNLTPQVAIMTNAIAGLSSFAPQLAYITNTMGQVVGLTNLNALMALTNLTPQVAVMTNAIAGLVSFAPQLAYITNTMGQVVGLTNLYAISVLTNLTPQIGILTNAIAGLANFAPQMAYITNTMGQVVGLTNLYASMANVTNAVWLLGSLTNLSPQVASLTNSMAGLANLPVQMSALTNVMDKVANMTNLTADVASMTNSIGQIARLTNIPDQVSYLTNVIRNMSGVTNIVDQVAAMTNSIGQIARLTNIPDQVSYLTNVIWTMSGVTNISSQVSAMTNSIAQIARLTNMPDQVSYLTNAIWAMGRVTNIADQVSAMTNSIAQIAALTNMPGQMSYLTNVIWTMGGLTNIPSQVSAMTNSIGQIARLTNMPDQVSYLTNVLWNMSGLTNMPGQMSYLTNVILTMSGVTNISSQVSAMTNSIAQVAALTNMPGQMSYLTNVIWTMSGVTNIPSQVSAMTNAIGQIAALTNIPSQVSSMTSSVAQVAALTNMPGQMSYLTNVILAMSGVTNISGQVSAMTNSIGQIVRLTNMPDQVSYLTNAIWAMSGVTNISSQMAAVTNAIWAMSGVTNISSQVSAMTNSIGQIARLTNMPDQVSYLTNAIWAMSGVTNIVDQVSSMTNSIGQITRLTNMPDQMSYLTNVIWAMSGVTNISGQVSSMTNSIGQIARLTNIADQVSYLTNVIWAMSGVTNISSQVSSMTNSIGQIARLTNIPDQVSYLTNVIGQLGNITNLAPQVDAMTNAFGNLAALTNLPAQMAYITNLSAQVSALTSSVSTLTGVTNLGARVDLILGQMTNVWTGVSYLTNSISAISGVTNIGGQVSAMTNSIGRIVQLTNMADQVSHLVNTIQWSDVATMKTAVTNLSAAFQSGNLASLQSALASYTKSSSNVMTSVQSRIGSNLDPATATTVFGRLAALADTLSAVGVSAQDAAAMARSAKSQASSAASAASSLKNESGADQMGRVLDQLGQIRDALNKTVGSVNHISDTFSTESLARTLNESIKRLEALAKLNNIPLGQPPETVEPGAFSDPKALSKLLNSIEQTKAMMEAMRLLMDEAVNKPVVTPWLEGSP